MLFLEAEHQDHSDSRIFPWQVSANTEPVAAPAYFNSGTLLCIYQYWNLPMVLLLGQFHNIRR